MRHRSLLLSCLALGLAAAVAGAEPAPRAVPSRVAPAPAPTALAPAKPLTPAERAIVDRRLAGQQQVQAAVARLTATSDPAARDAIQREIVALKRQTELDVLGMLAAQARARGEIAAAQAIDAQAALLLQPAKPGGPTVVKPAGDAARRPAEGGAR